jgi:hypothetical protein
MSMKNSNATIGNRTRDLPTCGVLPQPTALWRAPIRFTVLYKKCVDDTFFLKFPHLFRLLFAEVHCSILLYRQAPTESHYLFVRAL